MVKVTVKFNCSKLHSRLHHRDWLIEGNPGKDDWWKYCAYQEHRFQRVVYEWAWPQSKDHSRISRKIMLKKCSVMLCGFFYHSNRENSNFAGKSRKSDLFRNFLKSNPGYVVRKIHKESNFPVGFDHKFRYQSQIDFKELDDFHLIDRNSIIWLKTEAYCS